jgi:phytanoyl-CoA dioxygenase PhyH
MSPYSKFYYATRIHLHKHRRLLRCLQMARAGWILGPLRSYAVRYYRKFNHNQPLHTNRREIFSELDVDQVVDAIKQQGYADGIRLPAEYVSQIVRYCQNTGLVKYWNPHKECEAIDRLAHDSKVVEIARRYIGAEPILWLTQLKWSLGDSDERSKMRVSLHQEPLQYDGDAFHYDTVDFKSLTIFVYLTDVDPDSGPHVVIEGTHNSKSFAEICNIILNDAAAKQKFGDRIKMILGPQGTMFFEETSCFHKAARCKTMRLMLSIDYVLQRRPPPERTHVA